MEGQTHLSFELEGEVYKLHRRPGHGQIVVNDAYAGVRVVDARNGADVARVSFTSGYDRAGVISNWCFNHEGSAALTFNEEDRTACYLSLADGSCADAAFPDVRTTWGLSYAWEGESFWLATDGFSEFFEFERRNGTLQFARRQFAEARDAQPGWHAALGRLPRPSNVLRAEPDARRMLYRSLGARPGVGVEEWSVAHGDAASAARSWFAPLAGETPQLAYLEGRIFVLYEYDVRAVASDGAITAVHSVDEGFRFIDLDAIPGDGVGGGRLVVAAVSLGTPRVSRISVRALNGMPR